MPGTQDKTKFLKSLHPFPSATRLSKADLEEVAAQSSTCSGRKLGASSILTHCMPSPRPFARL